MDNDMEKGYLRIKYKKQIIINVDKDKFKELKGYC